MKILVDTSIWSRALRRGNRSSSPATLELRNLIADHRVEIIGPIRQEVLAGIRDPAQFSRLEQRLAAFSDLPIITDDYIAAARFFNLCRAEGIQGSNTDYLISAVAARAGLSVFTRDEDFPRYASHLPLVLHEL